MKLKRLSWCSRVSQATCQLAFALAMVMGGCAARPDVPAASVASTRPGASPPAPQAPPASSDRKRLEALWQKRTRDTFGSDFTLGQGDLLEISVPLEQLRHREVRVSPRDTIELPLVGIMPVKGMTEQSLTEALRERLSKYMYDPPISLFVKEYGSRQVAVTGAVEKPGLYTLMSASDTLMKMISKAGGTTRDAGAEVILVPAGARGAKLQQADFLQDGQASVSHVLESDMDASDSDEAGAPSARVRNGARITSEKAEAIRPAVDGLRDASAGRAPFGPDLLKLDPITIYMTDSATQNYLDLPARPGDVLIIPAAGEVTVGGWVQSPGAYKISPGMTTLSAVSAAGGALFSYSAEILRTAPDGERTRIPVDISKVQKGEQPDIPVQSGDVVMVDRSPVGAVPYALYEVFTKFGAGMAFPIP
jgi:polysaccharide export outer membrane protein